MRQIVVGFDGGEPSRHALLAAVELARNLAETHLQIVQVAQPVVLEATVAVVSPEMQEPELSQQRTVLNDLLSGGQVTWEYRCETGDPAVELARVAEELDAYLIVVGSRGHGVLSFVERLLAGSVSRKLVRTAVRPVLIVPLPEVQ